VRANVALELEAGGAVGAAFDYDEKKNTFRRNIHFALR
jgi:hypothetical protein